MGLVEELKKLEKRAAGLQKEESGIAWWISNKAQNNSTLEAEEGEVQFLEASQRFTYSLSRLEQVRKIVYGIK